MYVYCEWYFKIVQNTMSREAASGICRLRVVPLSLSPSCVTQKKWRARSCRVLLAPRIHVTIFLSRFSFAWHKEGQNRGTTRSLGIWRILKYYELLLLQNTTYRSCYYLFTMEAEKFSVTHKRPLLIFTVKNTQSAFATIFFYFNEKRNDWQVFVKPAQTVEGTQHEKFQWK